MGHRPVLSSDLDPADATRALPRVRACRNPCADAPLFSQTKEIVKTHHNQAATLASNKNASKAVRDKLKAQQAAAAVVDAAKQAQQAKQFTAKAQGPGTI